MKKILLILLSVTLAFSALWGCDKKENTSSPDSSIESVQKESYTVTFRQSGQKDVVKIVEEGKSLTDIPTPVAKTGYDVVWSITEFSNVTEDVLVEAVETPKVYTVTFNPNGGTVTPTTQEVTFDCIPATFPTPVREGFTFTCWKYGETVQQSTDVWKLADNVTLVAEWAEIKVEECTVTFVQTGYTPVEKTVVKGGTLAATEIPATQAVEGYTVVWENKSLENVTENIIVNAVLTPNAYAVTFNTNGGNAIEGTEYTYDGDYELPTPTRVGYEFIGWKNEDKHVAQTGKWTTASATELKAEWKAKTYTITLKSTQYVTMEQTMTVTFGEAYKLPAPDPTEEKHCSYYKYGDTKVTLKGTWNIDAEGIVLVAHWMNSWTDFY